MPLSIWQSNVTFLHTSLKYKGQIPLIRSMMKFLAYVYKISL